MHCTTLVLPKGAREPVARRVTETARAGWMLYDKNVRVVRYTGEQQELWMPASIYYVHTGPHTAVPRLDRWS
jgi:hypothetical protein